MAVVLGMYLIQLLATELADGTLIGLCIHTLAGHTVPNGVSDRTLPEAALR